MNSKNLAIRVTLKESRGDGDSVNIKIDSKENVEIKDKFVLIESSSGEVFMFKIENILYCKISESWQTQEPNVSEYEGRSAETSGIDVM